MFDLDSVSQDANDAIDNLTGPGPGNGVGIAPSQLPGIQITPGGQPGVAPPLMYDQAQPSDIPPMLQRGHGLLDRIARGITGGDRLQQMGYDKVGISDQQLEDARPGLFQSIVMGLAGVSPAQQYEKRMDDLVGHQVQFNQIAQQRNILANRAAVMKAFPPPSNPSTEQLGEYYQKIAPFMLNDPEVMKEINPFLDRMVSARQVKANASPFQAVQAGWGVTTFNKETGQFLDQDGQWKNVVDRGMTADQKQWNALTMKERVAALNQTLDIHNDQEASSEANRFKGENSLFLTSAQQYAPAKAALSLATTNPAADKTSILNFAGYADSRAQLRQGTIQFIQKIDPSFKGSVSQWFQQKLSGTLTPRLIGQMNEVIDRIHYTQASMYDERRNGSIGRVPGAARYIPNTEEIFGDNWRQGAPPPAAGAGDNIDAQIAAYRKSKGLPQ